jgi:hypothetical protein
MCAGILFCNDTLEKKTLALYDAMQDSYHMSIANSDADIPQVIGFFVYLTCYHLPELFKKNGGDVKDSDFEYPEYEAEHYTLGLAMLVDHFNNILFGYESGVTRAAFYDKVKNATCEAACIIENCNTGC